MPDQAEGKSRPSRDAFPMLRGIPFFALFDSDEDLELLLDFGAWLVLEPGNVLIRENQLEDTLYVIIKGKAGVYKAKKNLAVVQPNEIVGEIGALLAEPRTTSVVTLTDATVFRLNVSLFEKLPSEILYKVMSYIFRVTAHRLKDMDQKIVVK